MIAALMALFAAFTLQARQGIIITPPSGTAAIAGRVVRSDGRPLPRVDVRLLPVGRGAFVPAVSTDADGNYEFGNISAGRYRVSAFKGGFIALEYGQRQPGEPSAVVTVQNGQRVEHIDIALARSAGIVGHVYDETGDPVEGASVQASILDFEHGRHNLVDVSGALTDDRGRFRIWGLEPGRYVVSAIVGQIDPGPGMSDMPGYAMTYYPGSVTAGDAQAVSVGLSTDTAGVDFALVPAPTARVSGHAFHADGDPVTGGLQMRTSQRSGAVSIEVGAIINPGGEFIFPNVAPGEYIIQAFKSRGNRWTEGEFASQLVAVNGADVNDVLIRTTPGSTVSGRITIDPGATLSPHDVDLVPRPADTDQAPLEDSAIAHADIHDDWTFTLAGLHGPRRLRLVGAPPGWVLKSVLLNGTDVTDEPLPFGTPNQSLTGVEVVLTQSAAEIAGTVVDDHGMPPEGGDVIVFSVDSTLWYDDSRFVSMAPLQKDGTFDVMGLPAADYYVAAVSRLRGDEWQDPSLLNQLSTVAARVFAAEGQKTPAAPKLVLR